jgi:hypothetical protein
MAGVRRVPASLGLALLAAAALAAAALSAGDSRQPTGAALATDTPTATGTPDCAQPPMSPPVAACLTDTPTPSPTPTPTLTPTSTPCPGTCPPTPTPDCTQPTSPPNAGCVDSDNDGVADPADNCPGVANTYQENTDAANTALNRPGADAFGDVCDGDIDGDGYTNPQETALIPGKNPSVYCDIMRADVDGDHAVTILDMTVLAGRFLQPVPPAPERDKQDADNALTILDLSKMANLFLQSVSACP